MGEEGLRWFIAIVEDIMDPEKLGRVKIRVINEHDHPSITTDDLQWATPITPITSESYKQTGRSPTGLLPGSHVFGFYLDGNEKQLPVLWGSYAKLPGGSQDNNDVPALAREINSLTKTIVGPEPATQYAAKYPYNHVTQTQSGHVIEVDDTPANERLQVYHKSGTYVEISKDGQLVTKVVGDGYEIVVKDKTIYIGGVLNIEIKGDANIKIGGSATTTVGGIATVNAGKVNIKGDTEITGTLLVSGTVQAAKYNFS